jgi:TDG/mug DNA glycosylase family protein
MCHSAIGDVSEVRRSVAASLAMHPHVLPDYLAPGLRAIFVGTAAGHASAARGHYYAGPGNEFWSLLADAGLTAEYLGPDRDAEILGFGLGLTDLAKLRAASRDAELARSDFHVPALIAKMEQLAPRWVAFHGKTSAVEVSRALGHGRHVALGRQAWSIGQSRLFVLPSASGANRSTEHLEGKPSRLAWFTEFRRELDGG